MLEKLVFILIGGFGGVFWHYTVDKVQEFKKSNDKNIKELNDQNIVIARAVQELQNKTRS